MKKLLIFSFSVFLFGYVPRNNTGISSLNKEEAIKQENTPSDIFQIGVHYIPTDSSSTSYRILKDVKDANVNIILDIGNSKPSTQKTLLALALAEKIGVKLMILDYDIISGSTKARISKINLYNKCSSLAGYIIWDEPSLRALDTAALMCHRVLNIDPKHLAYVNLFPYVNMKNSFAYYEKWINDVGAANVQFLSTDYYPFMRGKMAPNLFYFLEIIRSLGIKYKINTSFYLQSSGWDNYYDDPSESQLRYNAYCALAYGIKFPIWYTYSFPTWSKSGSAITDRRGNKTNTYSSFKQINGEMQELGKTLKHLDADIVYHNGPDQWVNMKQYPVPANYLCTCNDKSKELIISHFKDRNSTDEYIMVVNKTWNRASQVINLSFNPSISNIMEISKSNGNETLTTFNPQNHTLSLRFLPGEGKLFKIYK